MEDEDEVVKAVEAPPPSEQQLSELPQGELPDVSEQCGAVSTAGDSPESLPPVSADGENPPSTVAEVVDTVDRKEIEKEGFHVEESEPYEKEQVAADEIGNVEDLPEIAEELEEETEEVFSDEIAKIEDLPPVTEELEEKNEIAMDEIVKVAEFPLVPEELEVKNEEDAEKEGDKVEFDVEGFEEVKGEEDEFKGEEEVAEGEAEEMEDLQVNGDHSSRVVTKDEELVEEEMSIADSEMETVKSGSGNGGKRKRGRNSKAAPARAPARKVVGEDVCFICLDGGDLVLCDRRGCPKAYHPSCVDHDDDFFKTKGRWNCGWHLCNTCGKNAYFMCYTCTFSLCKGCCKDNVVFCIRGNRGFCESCMKTVMMIENSEQNETGQVTFDDKSSWEYLFKDYWIEQKRKLCITSDELAQAKCPWKGSDATDKQQISIEEHDNNNDVGIDSDSSLGNLEVVDLKSKKDSKSKRAKRKSKSIDSDTDSSSGKDVGTAKRKAKRRLKSQSEEAYIDSEYSSGKGDTSNKRGNRPRKLSKSRSMDGNSAGAGAANEGISTEGSVEWASKELLEFVMHMKDGDTSVLTQFDVQGLLLEYIKRNKLRDPRRRSQIICDSMLQKLFGKPRVGHFEMLKLLESHFLLKENSQADDNHGSVVDEASQLDADDNTDFSMDAGRSKGRKSRKRGEERGFQSNLDDYAAIDMHNINLICLRRNLMEALMEDSETFHDKVVGSFVRIRISGSGQKQDIYRLVQIIGTSKAAEPYKVGKRTTDVMLEILNLDKTEIIAIDTISNQEFTEDECKRLRQSIKCGLISRMTVGDVMEKARELQEVRVIDWLEAEIVRLSHLRDRASEKGRKKELRLSVEKLQLLKTPEERQRRLEEIPEVHADPKMDPSCESEDESEMENKRQASNMRPRDSGFSRRGREHFSSRKGGSVSNDSWSANARPPNKNWEPNRNLSGKDFSSRREDTEYTRNNGVDKGTPRSHSWEKPRLTSDPLNTQAEYSGVRSDTSPVTPSDPKPRSDTSPVAQTDSKVSETEKMWHYRDPTSKTQGPFSMTQLRKWSNTGYFPADLRVWKTSQAEDDSILLTEVLAGRFQKELPSVGLQSEMASKISNSPSPVVTSKLGRYDSANLPSPTPMRSTTGWGRKQTSESKWSSGSSPFRSTNQFQGGNERLPSPTPTSPNPSVIGNKVENVGPSASVTNSTGQFISTLGPGSSQPGAHMAHQSFAPPDAGMNKVNLGPDAKSAAQGFSNVSQPSTGQNPPVYAHGWTSGYVARPEMVNTAPPQLPHGQWTGAPVNNQASSYGAGYPPGPGNIAPNMPPMQASHNAWRPAPTNMPWGGPQQQPVNANMGWTVPQPTAAFGPAAMGQVPGPAPGMSAMPSGNSTMGWQGPSGGTANPGWVAPPGNTGAWNGDQNRNGGGGGAQWNRQSSFGSGGQRVCKYFHETGHCRKGASCDFMHT